ncbi:carboxymuconolactone decarboxylase family protein [Streptacidiphilus sp. MAP5-3]|uniref:carboxymuconolactone decarboxylase family protein n=1 Tax=unclassified Streptacidiphilus TaxID=2643834 RepID=UPI00351410D7
MTEQGERQARFERGMALLEEVSGGQGQLFVDSMADVSPELAHQAVAWGYAEIYGRPQLAPRDRQLLTLGMLTALGGCEPELRMHIGTSLNVGLTPVEIVEALLQSAGYCGFPRAINATKVAKEVFAERGLLPVEGTGRAQH